MIRFVELLKLFNTGFFSVLGRGRYVGVGDTVSHKIHNNDNVDAAINATGDNPVTRVSDMSGGRVDHKQTPSSLPTLVSL